MRYEIAQAQGYFGLPALRRTQTSTIFISYLCTVIKRKDMYIDKAQLIQDIRDFLGEGGVLYFEHGYKPNFNAYGLDCNGVWHKTDHKYKKYEDMLPEQVANIVFEVFRYYNYCTNKA